MTSRAERRNNEKLARKKKEWYNSLASWQKEYVTECIDAIREMNVNEIIDVVDSAVSAVLIDELDFNMQQLYAINEQIGKNMFEIWKSKIEMGAGRMFKMRECEDKAVARIEEMISKGKKKTEIIKKVREEFKEFGVTTAEVTVAWKKTSERLEIEKAAKALNQALEIRDKINEMKSEEDVKDGLEYIFGTDKETPVQDPVALAEAVVTEEPKEEPQFVVLNEVIKRDVKGKYGVYKIDNKVMQFEDLAFQGVEDVREWAEDEREHLRKQIEELTAQIVEIDNRQEEAETVLNKFM